MTRAKDISKIVTDADLSGTLDVTGTVTAGGIVKSGSTGSNGQFDLARTSDGLSVGKITMTESSQVMNYHNLLGSGIHSFTVNSTERMRIDSSGNVGIGVSSISGVKMDVLATTSDNLVARFENNHATGSYGIAVKAGDDSGNYAADFANKSGTSLMRIRGDGNVGIGTSSPELLTHLKSSDNTIFQLESTTPTVYMKMVDSNTTGAGYIGYVTNDMTFWANNSERMRIDSSGNVGIGTTDPDGLLTLATANSTTPRLRLQHPTNNADATIDTYYDGSGTYLSIGTNVYQGSSAALTKFDSAKGAGLTYYDSSGQILFYNGGGGASISERMRIDTSGRFLLGTGAAIANAGGAIFQSSQQVNNWTSYIENYISSGNVYGQLIRFSGQSPDNNLSAFLACQDSSGTVRFYVYSDGDVANHDNSYGAISDEKLKEQITDASSQWDDVKALRVRKSKLKEDVSTKGDSDNLWRLGVVAQEVETAGMNGLVKDNPDLIENENGQLVAGSTTTKSVKYSILYMKAVKALQEAMTRIETLETANTALEARIVALETA